VSTSRHKASFRDPSGFLYSRDGLLYRQVNLSYQHQYRRMKDCGLYDDLTREGLLVSHTEADLGLAVTPAAYRVLQPDEIEFVSYPYEWCFSQLRDAALATLRVQRRALDHGMILKDASAYNVQFRACRPLLIDTLSFDAYHDGSPWVAYHQFCEHFLGPLLLMSEVDVRLGRLLATHIEGIPLELASRLLPRRSWLRPSRLLHIHLHARSVRRHGDRPIRASRFEGRMSRRAMDGLVDNLETAVRGLDWKPVGTEWADYDTTHGYSADALAEKKRLVGRMLASIEPGTVWDLGANVGTFSAVAASAGARVVAMDSDPAATERHYRRLRERGERSILPLQVDLRNPSPGLGWASSERDSLEDRGPADLVLALAVVHHLAIGGNVPLPMIADWLARLADRIIVEFVPKDDPQVRRLLSSREDIFSDYSGSGFESAFERRFRIDEEEAIAGTGRTLYRMTARER